MNEDIENGAKHASDMQITSAYDTEDDSRPSETEVDAPQAPIRILAQILSFIACTLCALIFSFLAKSKAMQTDAYAMIIDASFYWMIRIADAFTNHLYETEKWRQVEEQHIDGGGSTGQKRQLQQQSREQALETTMFQVKLLPSIVTTLTLVVVAIWVILDSVRMILIHEPPETSTPDDQYDPSFRLMIVFSSVNLGLDALNMVVFSRVKHMFGCHTPFRSQTSAASSKACTTHSLILVDLLRTLSALIAGVTAKFSQRVTSEGADATAAILLSLLTLLGMFPVLHELRQRWNEWKVARIVEKNEGSNHSRDTELSAQSSE